VVRVQAGRLRTKLHEYYETEGKGDRVIIALPKGQYTPVFNYAQKDEERNNYDEAGATDDALAIGVVSNPSEAPGMAQAGYVNGSVREATIAPPVGVVTKATRVIDQDAARRWRVAALVFALISVIFGALAFFYRAMAVELSEAVESRAR